MASPCCHCPPPHSPFLAICLLLHSHLILQEILLVHVPHGWMPTTSHPICHCHPGLRGHTPCNRPLIGSTPFRGFSSHLANNRSPFPAYTALRVLDLPTSPSPTPASFSSPRLPRPQRLLLQAAKPWERAVLSAGNALPRCSLISFRSLFQCHLLGEDIPYHPGWNGVPTLS